MIKYKSEIEDLSKAISKADTIGICGHASPDGDCLGSVVSLGLAIKKLGKNIKMILNDSIPEYLEIIDGLAYLDKDTSPTNYDLFIALDTASDDRLGPALDAFKASKTRAVVDHHRTNEGFGDINIIDPEASSTCEIVYEIISYLGLDLNEKIARANLVGILTDTNRFLYESTSPRTLEIASKLCSYPIDKEYLMQRLYQSVSKKSLILTREIIDRSIFLKEDRLAYFVMDKNDMEKLEISKDDLEGKINLIRDIDTVELAFSIREDEDFFKVSMRSKNHVNVSEIAGEFGGGGHKRAAGFNFDGPLDQLKKKLLQRLDEIDWSKK